MQDKMMFYTVYLIDRMANFLLCVVILPFAFVGYILHKVDNTK